MLALDILAKFSETSVNPEESSARWCHVPRLHSREYPRKTMSDTSPIRCRDKSLPLCEFNSLTTDNKNKSNVLQLWSSSVRGSSVSGSFQLGESSADTLSKKIERDAESLYEGEVKDPVEYDEITRFEDFGFGSSPPAAPVTVLKRNMKGVWTKFNVAAEEEDQIWLTHQPAKPSHEPTKPRDAAGPLHGPRRFVQRLLRELIASLPLLPSGANSVKKPKIYRPITKKGQTSRTRSPISRRSLRVQTYEYMSNDFQHKSSNCETRSVKHRERGGDNPTWAGGMRALRDAHVRLVLRQLRHVERLNRALDHRNHAPASLNTQ